MKKTIRKLLKNWLNKLEQPNYSDRKHVYTDKFGNAYYVKDILHYHGSRRVAIQAVIDQLSRGIDNDALIKLMTECAEHIKRNESTKAIGVLANIQSRTTEITSLKLLNTGALLTVLMEDEPDEKSKEFEGKKKAIWAKDEDARFFFINWCLSNLQGLELSSKEQCRRLVEELTISQSMLETTS
jgi:hypothetical protein